MDTSDFTYEPSMFADIETDTGGPDEYPLIPVGDHEFAIVEARGKTSSSGNPMIELTLEIEHDGRIGKVWDYVTFTDAARKVVASKCDALGLGDALRDGTLTPESFVGIVGRVRLRHQTSPDYGTREKVAWYHATTSAKPKPAPVPEINPDDIPF